MVNTQGRDSKGRFIAGQPVDTYPQWFRPNTVIESSAGAYTESSQAVTPVNRQTNQVMEILLVQWDIDFSGHQGPGADQQVNIDASLITQEGQASTLPVDDSRCIDHIKFEYAVIVITTGVGLSVTETTIIHDFASSGHGFLTAAPLFFLSVDSDSNLAAHRARCRVLYRLVTVSDTELIGMLTDILG